MLCASFIVSNANMFLIFMLDIINGLWQYKDLNLVSVTHVVCFYYQVIAPTFDIYCFGKCLSLTDIAQHKNKLLLVLRTCYHKYLLYIERILIIKVLEFIKHQVGLIHSKVSLINVGYP